MLPLLLPRYDGYVFYPPHSLVFLSSSCTTAPVSISRTRRSKSRSSIQLSVKFQYPFSMALYRRVSLGDNNDGQKESPEYPVAKRPKTKRKLLAQHEVPSWCSQNPFLLTGFRPPSESVQRCVESLGYVHNETVNIYSHLVPALITFARAAFIHLYFPAHYPNIV